MQPFSQTPPLSPPKIWLDGRNIGRTCGTGVHHYAVNHKAALTQAGFETSWLLEATPTTPPRNGLHRFLQAICGRAPHVSDSFQSPWGQAHLARDLYRIAHVHYKHRHKLLKIRPETPPDIMHWTYPLPILMEGCRNVVTVHDLVPLTHPELTGIDPTRFRQLMTDLVRHNVHFLTVSETVRKQMLSLFPLAPERVTTLYQPVDFDAETRAAIKNAPQIAPPDCFLFYGRVEHRKNIERLLEAHARSGTRTPLVIIGPDGDDRPDCTPRGPSSQVIRLPWSDRLSLLRTLSEAKALLFPSLAEGFGLPIIEAMALGTPVLTSRGGVTEEIAGGAALLVDPHNTKALTAAITQLDTLPPTEQNLIKNQGGTHAQRFSAENYSQILKKILTQQDHPVL